MTTGDAALLARFDTLLRALETCADEHERALRISHFVSDESQRWETAQMEFLRARDNVSDENLLSRMLSSPDTGEPAVFGSVREPASRCDDTPSLSPRQMDLKRGLTVGVVGFLAIVFGVVAVVGARIGAGERLIVLVAVLFAASALATVVIVFRWLRTADVPIEDLVDADLAWMRASGKYSDLGTKLVQQVDSERDFEPFNGGRRAAPSEQAASSSGDAIFPIAALNQSSAMRSIDVSVPHLAMSETLMRDALSGAMSPRGSTDAAFDSGYFALLSVLTGDERRAFEHPSHEAMQLAGSRLGIDLAPGLQLLRLRYSAAIAPRRTDALAWAEYVHQRIRAFQSQ